jgi:hypothetical protein
MRFSWEFYVYREATRPVLESQKLCTLTRVLCAMELSKGASSAEDAKATDKEEQKKRLGNALTEIEKCRRTCSKISEMKRKEIIANNRDLFGDSVSYILLL